MQNIVSSHISPEKSQAVKQAINTIKENLDFLIELDAEERGELAKLGPKGEAFVRVASDVVQETQGFLPQDFDAEEFQQDFQLFKDLKTILLSLNKLTESVESTSMGAGSDALKAALEVYAYAKVSNRDDLESIKRLLKDQYARRKTRKSRKD